MVIAPVIKIAQTVFRYRKFIYRTLVAQDRAIDKAFKVGGYSRQTRYGARHGALAGSLIGTLLNNNAPETPGNGIQKPYEKQPSPGKPYQARSRRPTRYRSEQQNDKYFGRRQRCPSPRKY